MDTFNQLQTVGKVSNIDGSVIQLGSPKSKAFFGNSNKVNALSSGISVAGQLGATALDSANTENNLKYGESNSGALRSTAGSVVSAINPVAGLIYSGVNTVLSTAGSAWNNSNKYDEFGYNHASKAQGASYIAAGYTFDPIGGMMRTAKTGGEGSGARMLMNLVNPIGAGIMQYKHEQEEGADLSQTRDMIRKSNYELNMFQHNPNLIV
jgi:hypothetical protein